MHTATIQEKIRLYVQDTLLGPGRQLSADDDLLGSGMVDSMGVMRLLGFLEDEFGRQVPYEDVTIENFSTVSAIAAYLSCGA